jgi:hypothetical protein
MKVPDPQIILDGKKISVGEGRAYGRVVPLSFTPVPSPRRVGDLCWRGHERMKLL